MESDETFCDHLVFYGIFFFTVNSDIITYVSVQVNETGIFARRATVDQALESLCYREKSFAILKAQHDFCTSELISVLTYV